MENNLTIGMHIKYNVLPKLKDDNEKKLFLSLSEIVDRFGVKGYSMSPQDFVLLQNGGRFEEVKKEDGTVEVVVAKSIDDELFNKNYEYTEQEWLNFLSHPLVSKFLENQILKINAVNYRQKLTQIASNPSISQADIKYISILKDIIDSARDNEQNDIIHISTFYPPRYNTESVKINKEYEKQKEEQLKMIINFLEIDSDYMDKLDIYKAIKKDEIMKKQIDEAQAIINSQITLEEAAISKKTKKNKSFLEDIMGD